MPDPASWQRYLTDEVMWAAWRLTKNWYASGEWADPSELTAWEADPWEMLRRLRADLELPGGFVPNPMPLVPYPKKGDRTRHYVFPSVRDQVAFNVYFVLLGPFLEARFPNVSLGHRLHRERIPLPREDQQPSRFIRGPFSLQNPRLYESFAAGYGLFRRLLQWKTNEALLPKDDRPESEYLETQDPTRLPYTQTQTKFRPSSTLYYVRLDLRMAYPSVRREFIETELATLAGTTQPDIDANRWGIASGPLTQTALHDSLPQVMWLDKPSSLVQPVLQELDKDSVARLQIASSLSESLKRITYEPWWQPQLGQPSVPAFDGRGTWKGNGGAKPEALPENRHGLPTGLGISGMLLNVALTRADYDVCRINDRLIESEKQPVVYLRFVDDIVLLATDLTHLESATKAFVSAIAPTGLQINVDKVLPAVLEREIRNSGPWDGSLTSIRPLDGLSLANASTFTTEVVREMSELGEQALDERYGGPAFERLTQLMDLAEREDEDGEVEDDARVSFALNKISRLVWPNGSEFESNGEHVSRADVNKKVLVAGAKAIRRYPWRFKLWNSLLRIAIRMHIDRTPGTPDPAKWFARQVHLLQWNQKASLNQQDPERPAESFDSPELGDTEDELTSLTDPDKASEVNLERTRRFWQRRLRASFQRAHFWRAWAATIRQLHHIANSADDSPPGGDTLQDLVEPLEASRILERFGDIQEWAKVLYGTSSRSETYWPVGPFLWWWEREALCDAMLAVATPTYPLLERLSGTPGLLRSADFSDAAQTLLAGEELADIRTALGASQAPKPVRGEPLDAPAQWILRMKGPTVSGESLFPDFRHRSKDPQWLARIARSNIWRKEPDLLPNLAPGIVFLETPKMTPRERLNAYHEIRRMLLALGRPALWGQFAIWLGAEIRSDARSFSLWDALLSVKGEPHLPASLPADPKDPAVAGWLVDQLPDVGRVICPQTITLDPLAFGAFVKDAPAHIPVRLQGTIGVASGLAPAADAPHAIFLTGQLLGQPKLGREIAKAGIFLLLVSGTELALDNILSGNPLLWRHSIQERTRTRYWLNRPEAVSRLAAFSGRPTGSVAASATVQPTVKRVVFEASIHDWAVTDRVPRSANLREHTNVRLIQLKNQPDLSKWAPRGGPLSQLASVSSGAVFEIAARLYEARLKARNAPRDGDADDIVLLPEWALPVHEERRLRSFCSETGIGVVAGMIPYELPPMVVSAPVVKRKIRRLVSEAVVMIPQSSLGKGTSRPTDVATFRIHKQIMSWSELGLEQHLSKGQTWAFNRNGKAASFHHPKWGDFAVAICSDLLGTERWRQLQGSIHHLLIPAWNTDVDLFDQLTRTRGYELFANVALANQGEKGGTLAWTPKSGNERELFRTRGTGHGIATTVALPLRALDDAQQGGVKAAIDERAKFWKQPFGMEKGTFKAPPPGFGDKSS